MVFTKKSVQPSRRNTKSKGPPVLERRAVNSAPAREQRVTVPIFPEDAENAERLARKFKVRLPRADAALTTGGMSRWLRLQLHMSVTAFHREYPDQNIRDFVRNNSAFKLKAWAATVLEMREYIGTS